MDEAFMDEIEFSEGERAAGCLSSALAMRKSTGETGRLFDIMKPPHADPSHPKHANYNPETDDYPEEEASCEEAWRKSGGIDADGMIWLTPRMQRNAKRLTETLMKLFRP